MGDEKTIQQWLEDLGMGTRAGGVSGPHVGWALSMTFGGTTHVSLAEDTRYPRRVEGISDLAISEEHREEYARLPKHEREAFDRRLLQVLLRRANVDFHLRRDDKAILEKISLRSYLAIEGLSPALVAEAVRDLRNATMELCVAIQETLGTARGLPLDRALTDPGYTSVVLQKGTLETLGGFQIPGETLDETILRAVRE